ncbi:replication protein A subunit RPA32, partial [Amanita muscaria]
GGGYLQGGSPFSANASPSGVRRNETSHSLRPVTVAQLAKATQPHTDAEWTVEGSEIGQVTLVAHVVEVLIQTTNRVFWLDDGTGRIEARCWLDTTIEEEVEKWAGIEENIYVRVTGGLKTFGNKRYINALHMRPIKDPHEIYSHILETIHTSLILERGPPPPPGQQQSRSSASTSAYTNQTYANDNGMEQYNHLPPLQKAIIQFVIENASGAEGVHIAAIVRGVNTDKAKIDIAIEKLLDEGHVFTTMDDSHFNVSR